MDFQELKELIEANIEDAQVEVTDLTGTRDHLALTVISDIFKGKMLLQQHQMVMDILKEKLQSEIHAVKIKTMTKEQALKHTL